MQFPHLLAEIARLKGENAELRKALMGMAYCTALEDIKKGCVGRVMLMGEEYVNVEPKP